MRAKDFYDCGSTNVPLARSAVRLLRGEPHTAWMRFLCMSVNLTDARTLVPPTAHLITRRFDGGCEMLLLAPSGSVAPATSNARARIQLVLQLVGCAVRRGWDRTDKSDPPEVPRCAERLDSQLRARPLRSRVGLRFRSTTIPTVPVPTPGTPTHQPQGTLSLPTSYPPMEILASGTFMGRS